MIGKTMATVPPPEAEVITQKCKLCDQLLTRDAKRGCLYCDNPICSGLKQDQKAPSQVMSKRHIDVKPDVNKVVEIVETMFDARRPKFKCPVCGMDLVPEQKSSRLYCSYCAARAEAQIKAVFEKEFARYEARIRKIVEEVITHRKEK